MSKGKIIGKSIKEMIDEIRKTRGAYEAKRLERAADEVPNLEKLYQRDALEGLFRGDNARGIMTMRPGDFERYASPLIKNSDQEKHLRYLAGIKGFEDVPFLEVKKLEDKKPKIAIAGHEGRHRSRVLDAAGEQASLVQFYPRASLREDFPRRHRDEYINALREELEKHGRMVTPEPEMTAEGLVVRPAIELPDVYKGGGPVQKSAGGRMAKSIGAMAAELSKKRAVLPKEEAEANLRKMLESSKVQQRLYHGTTATEGGKGQEAIRRFKPSKEGALGSGSYLTPAPSYASGYADQAGGNILPVYAQIKNPLVIEGKGDPMIEALIKLGMDEDKASRMVERAYENKGYIGKEVESRARAAGYDGLMQYRDGELSEVVSYNPNAIKSAIGNVGTYDTSVPDLSKAEGGPVHKQDGGIMEAIEAAKKSGKPRAKIPLGGRVDIEQMRREVEENARRVAEVRKELAPTETKYSPSLKFLPKGTPESIRYAFEKAAKDAGPSMQVAQVDGKPVGVTSEPGGFGEALSSAGALLDIPSIAAGEEAFTRTGSPALAAAAYTLTDPIGAVMGAPAAGRAAIKGAKALAPKLGETAEQYMFRTGMALPLDVWHGSPHRLPPSPKNPLGEFDPTKIGTGEGNQAFGHGHYLAEARGTGEIYRKKLSSQMPVNHTIAALSDDVGDASKKKLWVIDEGDVRIASADDTLNLDPNRQVAAFAENEADALRLAKLYDNGKLQPDNITLDIGWSGSLYKVDLPDEQIAKMLDWDKPLSEQSKEVRDALAKWVDSLDVNDPEKLRLVDKFDNPKNQNIKFGQLYNEATSSLWGKDTGELSRQLQQSGIPGIKYLDQASRDAGEGTRNFVVFPGGEDMLTIKERMKDGGKVKNPVSIDAMRLAVGGAATSNEAMLRRERRLGKVDKPVSISPKQLARGWAAGTLGLPGDIESLGRMVIPGASEDTFLPTSEDMLKKIPGAATDEVGQRAAQVGTLFGGAGAGRIANAIRHLPTDVMRAATAAYGPQATASHIFIGWKSPLWNVEAGKKAVELEKAGVAPVDIWKQTGTFRSPDGDLRQEISDVGSKFRGEKEMKELVATMKQQEADIKQKIKESKEHPDLFPKQLKTAQGALRQAAKEIKQIRTMEGGPEYRVGLGNKAGFAFEHPELYEAYPKLLDMDVKQGGRYGSAGGSYMKGIDESDPGTVNIYDRGLNRNPRSVMTHEVQHAIQNIEGWGKGGDPTFAFNNPEAFKILKEIREKAAIPIPFDEWAKHYEGTSPEFQKRAYEKYLKNLPASVKGLDREYQEQAARLYYDRLAGEAEARAAQARIDLTPEQRLEKFPLEVGDYGYDVKPEDIIVKRQKKGGQVSLDAMRLAVGGMAGGGIRRLMSEGIEGAIKAGKTAEKVKQYATPAKFERAPVKTKAEVEALAQRMAPQFLGEFVRKPESTFSVAGKSMKQYKREKDLPIVYGGERPTPDVFDITKHEGEVMVGVPGDPTIAHRTLEQIGDIRPDAPVELHGGPLYGLEGEFWASGKGPATGLQAVARRGSEAYGGVPVVGQYIRMPEGTPYALHTTDALLSFQRPEMLGKRKLEQLNAEIRRGNLKNKFPEFVGFEDPDLVLLQAQDNPNLRKHINNVLLKPTTAEKYGLYPGPDIDAAITEAGLRNLETGATGFSVGRLFPESKLIESAHPTYEFDIPGRMIGQTKYPQPYELTFPDALKFAREGLKPGVGEFGMLKMIGPRQIIDAQLVDEINMYQEAMKKLTGKKKGGTVKKAVGGGVMSAGQKLAKAFVEAGKKAKLPEQAKEAASKGELFLPDEEVKRMQRELLQGVKKPEELAVGGQITSDDLILEERPL